MTMPHRDITRMLNEMGVEERASGELMSLVYDELHDMASAMMRRERVDHTLQPTSLVHEAFLRLVDSANVTRRGRLCFLEAASVTMRRILVDHARRRATEKRGAGWERVTLTQCDPAGGDTASGDEVDVLRLHQALEALEHLDARQAKIVELRFFSGMTGQDIADHLGVSRNTVVRELAMSRAWLRRALAQGDSP